MIHEFVFADREELANALASSVADSLYATLTARARASLVVSGGSTPLPFFAQLRSMELPWTKVTVTLADERWVDAAHPDSNEKLVREQLLQGAAAAAQFVGLKTNAESPLDACDEVAQRLAPHRPFEIVVLGMGSDGHTASLFPHEEHLEAALDGSSLCAPSFPQAAAHPRLSLTPKVLLDCRRLILHITGDDKRRVYEQARDEGPIADLPVRSILHQSTTDVDVYWSP